MKKVNLPQCHLTGHDVRVFKDFQRAKGVKLSQQKLVCIYKVQLALYKAQFKFPKKSVTTFLVYVDFLSTEFPPTAGPPFYLPLMYGFPPMIP